MNKFPWLFIMSSGQFIPAVFAAFIMFDMFSSLFVVVSLLTFFRMNFPLSVLARKAVFFVFSGITSVAFSW